MSSVPHARPRSVDEAVSTRDFNMVIDRGKSRTPTNNDRGRRPRWPESVWGAPFRARFRRPRVRCRASWGVSRQVPPGLQQDPLDLQIDRRVAEATGELERIDAARVDDAVDVDVAGVPGRGQTVLHLD